MTKARPEWLTDEMLAEMRRLKGSSEFNKMPATKAYNDLFMASYKSTIHLGNHGQLESLFVNGLGPGRISEDTCWLTEAGHAALEAIEAKESAEKWVPKEGDRVRVTESSGDGYKNWHGQEGVVRRCTYQSRVFLDLDCGDTILVRCEFLEFVGDKWVPKVGDRVTCKHTAKCGVVERWPGEDYLHVRLDGEKPRLVSCYIPGHFWLSGDQSAESESHGQRLDGHREGPEIYGAERASYLRIKAGIDPEPVEVVEREPCPAGCNNGVTTFGLRCMRCDP